MRQWICSSSSTTSFPVFFLSLPPASFFHRSAPLNYLSKLLRVPRLGQTATEENVLFGEGNEMNIFMPFRFSSSSKERPSRLFVDPCYRFLILPFFFSLLLELQKEKNGSGFMILISFSSSLQNHSICLIFLSPHFFCPPSSGQITTNFWPWISLCHSLCQEQSFRWYNKTVREIKYHSLPPSCFLTIHIINNGNRTVIKVWTTNDLDVSLSLLHSLLPIFLVNERNRMNLSSRSPSLSL